METKDYSDIIHLQRPPSAHPRMPMEKRAAQFAPFAALTGHKGAIRDTEKITEEMVLNELEKMEIDGI